MKRDTVAYAYAGTIHLCRRKRVLRAALQWLRAVAAFLAAPKCDLTRGKQ
jgi:hypothetical protein